MATLTRWLREKKKIIKDGYYLLEYQKKKKKTKKKKIISNKYKAYCKQSATTLTLTRLKWRFQTGVI